MSQLGLSKNSKGELQRNISDLPVPVLSLEQSRFYTLMLLSNLKCSAVCEHITVILLKKSRHTLTILSFQSMNRLEVLRCFLKTVM